MEQFIDMELRIGFYYYEKNQRIGINIFIWFGSSYISAYLKFFWFNFDSIY